MDWMRFVFAPKIHLMGKAMNIFLRLVETSFHLNISLFRWNKKNQHKNVSSFGVILSHGPYLPLVWLHLNLLTGKNFSE